jgi:uncharacterized RDD family membrane protein YckC
MRFAGFWRRFGAALIDGLVLGVVMTGLGAFGVPIYRHRDLATDFAGSSFAVSFQVDYNELGMVLGVLLYWLYFASFESSRRQATLGKMALAIRVTDLAGGRIGFGRASGRYFAKYLSAAILMIGFAMAGFTARKQALHDLVAGTLVVDRTP